jgi:hypothetical protein
MARRSLMVGIALAVAVATTAVAETRSIPNAGLTFDDVVDWAQDQGLDAKKTKDALGHTIVATSVNGTPFSIYLLDCSNDRCGSIQFAANWPGGKIAPSRVNDWNREKRWARAYLSGSKTLWIESDFDLAPGGTYELLNDEFATWKNILKSVKEFFDVK